MSANTAAGAINRAQSSPVTATSFTIAGFAFMPNTPTGDWSLCSLDDGSAHVLEISSGGASFDWDLFNDSTQTTMFTAASAVGKWVSFALVGAPTTSTVYWSIAGAAISNTTIGSSAGGAGSKIWLGDDGFGGGTFPGVVVGGKVWGASLTAAQVANEFQQLEPVLLANLWAQYPLLNSADALADYSGNGRTATLLGSLSDSIIMPPIPWRRNQNVMSL